MTLELALETAYAAVLRANEPTLAEVSIRLAHAGLDQAPATDEVESDPSKEKLPSITLTAKKTREMMANNSGVFALELAAEAKDVAQREGSGGLAFDALCQAAVRPMIYANAPTLLTESVSGFLCYGVTGRGNGSDPVPNGNTISIRESATFICTLPQ